jgi:hypothetical protein
MEGGQLVENGEAHLLLQDPQGALSKMVAATGAREELHLRALAAKAFDLRRNTKNAPDTLPPSSPLTNHDGHVNFAFDLESCDSEITKL